MRRFIAMVMTGPFGDDWMDHRLPNGILDSWKQKQQSDLKTGAEVQPLIDYANFADYQRIIKLKLNWSTVFKQYFGRPEDIRESL